MDFPLQNAALKSVAPLWTALEPTPLREQQQQKDHVSKNPDFSFQAQQQELVLEPQSQTQDLSSLLEAYADSTGERSQHSRNTQVIQNQEANSTTVTSLASSSMGSITETNLHPYVNMTIRNDTPSPLSEVGDNNAHIAVGATEQSLQGVTSENFSKTNTNFVSPQLNDFLSAPWFNEIESQQQDNRLLDTNVNRCDELCLPACNSNDISTGIGYTAATSNNNNNNNNSFHNPLNAVAQALAMAILQQAGINPNTPSTLQHHFQNPPANNSISQFSPNPSAPLVTHNRSQQPLQLKTRSDGHHQQLQQALQNPGQNTDQMKLYPQNGTATPLGSSIETDDTNMFVDNGKHSSNANIRQRCPQITDSQSLRWSERFNELVSFKQRQGHCSVPSYWPTNSPLSQWVKRQRYQYKLFHDDNPDRPSTLTDERIAALESIGFVWDSHQAFWEERLNELLLFREMNGHVNVPTKYDENPQLGVWCKCQRRQYKIFMTKGPKKSYLTTERIQKLLQIGFVFDPRAHARQQRGARMHGKNKR